MGVPAHLLIPDVAAAAALVVAGTYFLAASLRPNKADLLTLWMVPKKMQPSSSKCGCWQLVDWRSHVADIEVVPIGCRHHHCQRLADVTVPAAH